MLISSKSAILILPRLLKLLCPNTFLSLSSLPMRYNDKEDEIKLIRKRPGYIVSMINIFKTIVKTIILQRLLMAAVIEIIF